MRVAAFMMGLALILAPFSATRAEPAQQAAEAKASRVVMTWMPPYSRSVSWERLRAKYQGAGPSTALTHLGLQFWAPSAGGGLERPTKFGTISDAEVKTYVDWAHSNGVKVMLTVYNGVDGWDWPLAKNAFANNQKSFVRVLVAEMQRLKLDGIDVDLEGVIDATPDDKTTYVAFIKALSKAVRAKGKTLQLDSFHYIYNAPNQTWWAELFPHVDAISSMGYEDLGRSADGWQSYDAQRAAAGSKANMSKLIIGVPTYLESWQGDAALAQVKWFTPAKTRVGLGLWDAQDQAEAFRSKPIWRELEKIRAQN